MRVCTKCGKAKPRDAFSPRAAGRDGINSICRHCIDARRRELRASNHEATRAKEREYENRPEVKLRAQAQRYGLSPEVYTMWLELQDHACALCYRKPEKPLVPDHDHATEGVRGFLCRSCNIALGQARDDPALLRRMADYVESHALIAEVDEEEWAAMLNG